LLTKHAQRGSGIRLSSAVVLLIAVPACAHLSPRDYVFGAEGVVTDAVGVPVEGVRVVLTIGGPEAAYQAIEPVRERVFATDAQGRFQFLFITHHLETPYVLRLEKSGYQPQTVEATSPPIQKHAIQLSKDVPRAR
jgi:Carboxypeptidase regulatory-like domain